jgi:hypothetical protein
MVIEKSPFQAAEASSKAMDLVLHHDHGIQGETQVLKRAVGVGVGEGVDLYKTSGRQGKASKGHLPGSFHSPDPSLPARMAAAIRVTMSLEVGVRRESVGDEGSVVRTTALTEHQSCPPASPASTGARRQLPQLPGLGSAPG